MFPLDSSRSCSKREIDGHAPFDHLPPLHFTGGDKPSIIVQGRSDDLKLSVGLLAAVVRH